MCNKYGEYRVKSSVFWEGVAYVLWGGSLRLVLACLLTVHRYGRNLKEKSQRPLRVFADMASLVESDVSAFTFHPLEGRLPSLRGTSGLGTSRSFLAKWDLDSTVQAHAFRFDQQFLPEQLDAFLRDFFSDVQVSIRAGMHPHRSTRP